jgi:hypothetical protein
MEGVELEVRPNGAAGHRPQGAQAQDRRARPALHPRIVLLDTMYDLPTMENVSRWWSTRARSKPATGKPILIYADQPKVAGELSRALPHSLGRPRFPLEFPAVAPIGLG